MKNFLFGIALILVACNGQKKTIVESVDSQASPNNTLVMLVQDEYSGFEVEETTIIKDEKRLKSFYSKINRTRKPGLPVPTIDFSKEMIVIHCNGLLNYGGVPELSYSDENDNQVILDSKITKNSNSNSSISTHLFCVYKMPLTDKEIIVERAYK